MDQTQPRLADMTYVVLDTETTGLHPMMHRLVEIGAIRFRLDGRTLATFQALIDPHSPMPPGRPAGARHHRPDGPKKPTVAQVIPQFVEFLGDSDTTLSAQHVPFDLSFLAMALTRLGIAYPLHTLFDTLDMARRLYPTWPSYSLEHVATQLKVANRAEHRALSDARLAKDIFLAMLKDILSVNTITDVMRVSQPVTFADAPVCTIEPPPGFEVLTTAMAERCTITIVYEQGWQRPTPRMITPRLVLEVYGVA
jgi:DNA polymerase III epsilon subunit family exonuclease